MPDPPGDIQPTTDAKFTLQAKKMDLEAGWVGRIIGGPKNAPHNIAFIVVGLILVAGIGFGFAFPADRGEFWKMILPIVTLTLGYLFGKGSSS